MKSQEATVCSRRVDLSAGTSQHLPPDATFAQRLGCDDQMTEVTSQTIHFLKDECVAKLKRLEEGRKAGVGIMPTQSEILINP